jgi:uncharacterized OB-fold protein
VPYVISPKAGHDDQYFWDGVSEGKLLARACANCRGCNILPRR